MYTLYTSPGTRAVAAEMVMAELGVEYRPEYIDITRDDHLVPEFLERNPRATIPALAKDGRILACETVAIMLFIADRHGPGRLSPPVDSDERAIMLDWLVYHATEVQEPVKRNYYAHRYTPASMDSNATRQLANDMLARRWQIVEDHLAKNGPFHLGNTLSLADIYLLVCHDWTTPLAGGSYPAIEACARGAAERPDIASLYRRHLAVLEAEGF